MAIPAAPVPATIPSAAPATPVIEITAPDISPYRRGNAGIPHALSFESGATGPHAVICAVMHGNEISGAIVLDAMLKAGLRPRRGRLSLVFANTAAYATFDPDRPLASRYIDEDMNRLWTRTRLTAPHNSIELTRARALLPLVETADMLLDLHSMQSPAPPLLLAGPAEKGRALALALHAPAITVTDSGHNSGTRLRDFEGLNDPADDRNALLAECGEHWRRDTVAAAQDIAYRFLNHLGMVDDDTAVAYRQPGRAAPHERIEVTETVISVTVNYRFVRHYENLEVVTPAGTLIATDENREIRTPYDNCVLVMPTRRPLPGQTAVRLGKYIRVEPAHGG